MARAHRLHHARPTYLSSPPIHYRAGAPRLFSFQCPRTGEVGGIHERRFMAGWSPWRRRRPPMRYSRPEVDDHDRRHSGRSAVLHAFAER